MTALVKLGVWISTLHLVFCYKMLPGNVPFAPRPTNSLWAPHNIQRSFGMTPNFSGLHRKLFKGLPIFSFSFNEEEILSPAQEQCASLGGTLVNNECYEFFRMDLPFDDAREFCQARNGGDLWTPDFNDVTFFHAMVKKFPEFTGAIDDQIWIGAMQVAPERKVTIDGEDVTNTYLGNIGFSIDDGDCIELDFSDGAFFLIGEDCSTDSSFICEYPLMANTQKLPLINKPFGIWNKFHGLG